MYLSFNLRKPCRKAYLDVKVATKWNASSHKFPLNLFRHLHIWIEIEGKGMISRETRTTTGYPYRFG